MKDFDALMVGEVYIDHIFSGFRTWPKPGEELFSEEYTREIGGGAVNTACGLAKLGRRVGLIGLVGTVDAPWLRQRLHAFGVDTQHLSVRDGETGITVSLSTREDRSLFTYLGVNASLNEVLSDPLVLTALSTARHVHFALPLAQTLAKKLLPKLRDAGCTTSLDVGFQPQWLTDPANYGTCEAVDCLLPNEKEAGLFSGSDSTEAFFGCARGLGLSLQVIKLGARGAVGAVDGDLRYVQTPSVQAVDTTGAGDAFDAGFIDAWLDGESTETCLRRACVCGALSTRASGALASLPDRNMLRGSYERTYES